MTDPVRLEALWIFLTELTKEDSALFDLPKSCQDTGFEEACEEIVFA